MRTTWAWDLAAVAGAMPAARRSRVEQRAAETFAQLLQVVPVLAAGHTMENEQNAANCGEPAKRQAVAQHMPALADLREATVAMHRVYQFADARATESDAWVSGCRAGDVNQIPYNHHAAIRFLQQNRRLGAETHAFAKQLLTRQGPGLLSVEEQIFVVAWIKAWDMLERIEALSTRAPFWTQMHAEYGEWADPREQ